MKILFICKHNRFRSKVAEAIFDKLNKNKKIDAESAGLIMDEARPYIAKNVLDVLKDKGYFAKGIPKRITSQKINTFDIIVIVADNVNKEFFNDSFKGKIIQWKIEDASEDDLTGIIDRVDKVEKHIKRLVEELK